MKPTLRNVQGFTLGCKTGNLIIKLFLWSKSTLVYDVTVELRYPIYWCFNRIHELHFIFFILRIRIVVLEK